MSGLGSLGARLYRGETSYDFIARRRIWYAVAALLMAISLLSILVRGFHLGIEFKGGAEFRFPAGTHSIADARSAVVAAGIKDPIVQKVGADIRVQTPPLKEAEVSKVSTALSERFGVPTSALSPSTVGAAWGRQITNSAVKGLIGFLIAVVVFISLRFEPRMAASAIVALIHDVLLTAGIYSILGFEVTPATVIALLTILGYSLYDTVVVFDKVQENTRGLTSGSRSTFSQAANLAVNQTLARSINTSLIALLPVAGLLFIGAGLLGAGVLKDLSLALFVGIASGAYSSIFLATPVLADLKEREPQFKALAARVAARQGGGSSRPPRAARSAVAAAPSPARTATAVIEPGEQPAYDDPAVDPGTGRTGAGARPARPRPAQQQRRRKGNRPSGKKRR